MEPFIELPFDEWPNLMDMYKARGQERVVAHTLLDTQQTYPALRKDFGFKIYCYEADMKSDVIAIDHKRNFVYIFPASEENTTNLENALVKTKLLDFNRFTLIYGCSPSVLKLLEKIKDLLGVCLSFEGAKTYFLSKDSELYDLSSSLPDTYVSALKPENIEIVDSTWAYHSKGSNHFFRTLNQCGLIWALYSSEEKLLAWIALNDEGVLQHLYCLEEHRMKGYAEYISKIAVNDLLRKGKNVVCYIKLDNRKALNLFEKLGFEMIGNNTFIGVMKYN